MLPHARPAPALEGILANDNPKTDKPQHEKPGAGRPDQVPNKPDQQEQKSGSQGQPSANPQGKPQQG